HHIITDKWSMGILRDQLAQNYYTKKTKDRDKANEIDIQFTDYASWIANKPVEKEHLDYWKSKLSGQIQVLPLPTDYPNPKVASFKGSSSVNRLNEGLSSSIIAASKSLKCTPYVFLLSAYYILLYRYSGQKDITVGSPISKRDSQQLEKVIGFFDESIVMRTELESYWSFKELVDNVNETVLKAFAHRDVSFDTLVREINPERVIGKNPFFRTMFIYHDVPENPDFGNDLTLKHTFYNTGVSKFDLTLYIAREANEMLVEFEYSTELFEKATIQRLHHQLEHILKAVFENVEFGISEIPMLTSVEKKIMGISSPGAFPEEILPPGGIHQIIEKVAAEHPSQQAVVYQDESIDYAELDKRAAVLALKILKHTDGQNVIVGLCLPRSVDMVVGLYAILKAGAAYLPIDPDYPSERINWMLQDAQVPLLITSNTIESPIEVDSLFIEDISIKDRDLAGLTWPEVDGSDLAYIIYTSGSTGKPKGVKISHDNIKNSTNGRLAFYDVHPSVFYLMSSISFDSSKAGIFWTLCTAGTLIVAEKGIEQDIERLSTRLANLNVSHTLMLPSLYQSILEFGLPDRLQNLDTVIVAGEACPPSLCSLHYKRAGSTKLYNEYGPTEATVWCIAHHIRPEDNVHRVPIGKSVAQTDIYILNDEYKVLPLGATGEICIGGPGLSSGYLNNQRLTDESFAEIEIIKGQKSRLYKTGDLGRYRNDGVIEFLGRVDQQVKIRGHRIELEEVNEVIRNSPMIKEAVVLAEKNEERPAPAFDNLADRDLHLLVKEYLTQPQADELLASVESLSKEKKTYLLEQLKMLGAKEL
ncbi:MAG: amino acid adenylation domain-containing protein, partial [Flavobacteriaceae bacterium]